MKITFKSIVLVGFLFIIFGCQSKPLGKIDPSGSGVWQGKVRIVDSSRNKSLTGNIIWVSDAENQRMRIDVSAFFGISIATLIMESDEAWLWLHRERKFYGSDNPANLFEKLAKIKMDPKIFFWILQEDPKMEKPWECTKKDTALRCLDREQKIQALVSTLGERKKVNLKQADRSLVFSLQRSKVQVPEKSFHDKGSLGYKHMNLL